MTAFPFASRYLARLSQLAAVALLACVAIPVAAEEVVPIGRTNDGYEVDMQEGDRLLVPGTLLAEWAFGTPLSAHQSNNLPTSSPTLRIWRQTLGLNIVSQGDESGDGATFSVNTDGDVFAAGTLAVQSVDIADSGFAALVGADDTATSVTFATVQQAIEALDAAIIAGDGDYLRSDGDTGVGNYSLSAGIGVPLEVRHDGAPVPSPDPTLLLSRATEGVNLVARDELGAETFTVATDGDLTATGELDIGGGATIDGSLHLPNALSDAVGFKLGSLDPVYDNGSDAFEFPQNLSVLGSTTLAGAATLSNATVGIPNVGSGTASVLIGRDVSGNLVTRSADVVDGPGAGTSTDNAIARWDGTTGRLLQDASNATLSDAGSIGLSANGAELIFSGYTGTPSVAADSSRVLLRPTTTTRYEFRTANMRVPSTGTNSAPNITRLGDDDTGLTFVGADDMRLGAGGTYQLGVNTVGIATYGNSTMGDSPADSHEANGNQDRQHAIYTGAYSGAAAWTNAYPPYWAMGTASGGKVSVELTGLHDGDVVTHVIVGWRVGYASGPPTSIAVRQWAHFNSTGSYGSGAAGTVTDSSSTNNEFRSAVIDVTDFTIQSGVKYYIEIEESHNGSATSRLYSVATRTSKRRF